MHLNRLGSAKNQALTNKLNGKQGIKMRLDLTDDYLGFCDASERKWVDSTQAGN